jgi:cell division septation protein DedD
MGLIKNRVIIAITLFLLPGMGQWAQNSWQTGPNPWQFGTEILNLEQKLAGPGISAFERYDALVRLARLRQLSGNIQGAAANWLDAVAINPNDDSALVAGAYCLTAIGEWERAYQAIQPLVASTRRGPATLQAFYLDAYLKTWSYANASPLAALAANPDFTSLRPMIYYTLWQILTRNPNISGAGGADTWKIRLIAEYPGSPEALIAGSRNGGAAISAVQSPMWLLFPGPSVVSPAEPARPPASTIPPASTMPQTPVQTVQVPRPVEIIVAPNSQAVVPAPQSVVTRPPAPPAPVLQTGLFSRETNARAQVEALRKAGFTAAVSRKLVNGAEHWAVTVPAGQNQSKTMQDLKKAGFDSFPVKYTNNK